MSLTYLYNKLENMNSREQYAYIQNIFLRFQIRPKINIDEIFHPKSDKDVKNKNPLGYLVMHLNLNQLEELVPQYYRDLVGHSTFDDEEQYTILNIIDNVVNSIKIGKIISMKDILPSHFINHIIYADVLKVFEFGAGKYPEWNFLKHNPYQLVLALFRHLYKLQYIRPFDDESGCPHLAHAVTNIRMIQLILENKHGA